MKKKTLVPLIVFLLGICLTGVIVYKTDTHEKAQRHVTAQLNAATYGEDIKNKITNGIEITDALKQVLISEDGAIHQFDTIAKNLISDSIESVQLAPDGVVTDIYPAEGNEAGKIDLLHDKDRGKVSCYARDNHTIITQGPFELEQGGCGIAVRNPVYLKDEGDRNISRDLRSLSCVFRIFFQTQSVHLRISGMNTAFQKQPLPGVTLIRSFISQMARWLILFLMLSR